MAKKVKKNATKKAVKAVKKKTQKIILDKKPKVKVRNQNSLDL